LTLKGKSLYDYLTRVFEHAASSLETTEQLFLELEPYMSSLPDHEKEVLYQNFNGLQKATTSIRNPDL